MQFWCVPLTVTLASTLGAGPLTAPVQEGVVGRGGRIPGGFVEPSSYMRSHRELNSGDSSLSSQDLDDA